MDNVGVVMYCSNCGNQIPDGTRFCPECGAPQAPAQTPQGAEAPPDQPTQTMAPPPPSGKPSNTIWIVLACVGVVVIALAIALPIIIMRGGDGSPGETIASSTTGATTPSTSATTTESTETTEPATSTTEAPTTTTAKPPSDIPGDSAGRWAETDVSGIDQTVNEVALSDEVLLLRVGGALLGAYMFDSGETVAIPTGATMVGGLDVDGTLAVWWEADGAEAITDAHIYAMRLPDGPKVEVAAGANIAYPQVTKGMIAWVESRPWASDPDAWSDHTIKAATVGEDGQPTGATATLVDYGSAVAATLGDSTWNYSLSERLLAWEQQTDAGDIGIGSYVLDLAAMEPWNIARDAWRPSLAGDRVVFTQDGVEYASVLGDKTTIDAAGDYPTGAPTYAAYFRPTPSGGGTSWAIVAKGYTGKYEQVLLEDAGSPPWFLPPIAASGRHVAFTVDGRLRLFTWHE